MPDPWDLTILEEAINERVRQRQTALDQQLAAAAQHQQAQQQAYLNALANHQMDALRLQAPDGWQLQNLRVYTAAAGLSQFNLLGGAIPWGQAPPGAHFQPESKASAESVDRAYALLEEAIGKAPAAKVKGGGSFPVPSKRYPDVEYLVPRSGMVKVMQAGRCVSEVCIQAEGGLPWPDQVLAKIKAIQADETVVYGTGVHHQVRSDEEHRLQEMQERDQLALLSRLLVDRPDFLLRRILREDEALPPGYGIAWYNPQFHTTTCYPIPINLLMGWLRAIYFWLRRGPVTP